MTGETYLQQCLVILFRTSPIPEAMDLSEDACIHHDRKPMHTCVAAISHALRIATTTSRNNIKQTAQEQCYALLCAHFAVNQPQQVSYLRLIISNTLIPKIWLPPTQTGFDETLMVTSENNLRELGALLSTLRP